jgi:hypothetical protein
MRPARLLLLVACLVSILKLPPLVLIGLKPGS